MGKKKKNSLNIARIIKTVKGKETTVIYNAVNVDNKKTNLQHFNILKLLGGGGFGKVYLVKKNRGYDCCRLYAMKVIQKGNIESVDSIQDSFVEREILQTVRKCPFLMTMHYAFQDSDIMCLVLEYVPGDMAKQMHYQMRNFLTVNETRFYVGEIVTALEYLHERFNIIHRDIKLENILLDREGHVLLTDFGISKKFPLEEISTGSMCTNTRCGTIDYMAPEVINEQKYSFSVDWWSVGVLAYRLISGRMPFSPTYEATSSSRRGIPFKRKTIERILHKQPNRPTFDSDLSDFIWRLLRKVPHERLGGRYDASEVKEHNFFLNAEPTFNWNALNNKRIQPPFIPIKQYNEEDIANAKPIDYADVYSKSISVMDGLDAHFSNFSYVAPSLLLPKNSLIKREKSKRVRRRRKR